MRVTVKKDLRALRIFINDLIHLELVMADYYGFQAWQEGSNSCVYKIQFYRDGEKNVLCEYEDREIWKQILKGLEEAL